MRVTISIDLDGEYEPKQGVTFVSDRPRRLSDIGQDTEAEAGRAAVALTQLSMDGLRWLEQRVPDGPEDEETPELDLAALREKLAAIEHQRWADWQQYLHNRCLGVADGTGALIIPGDMVARWERQIATPYAELTEAEKQSDRDQVDRYWPLITAWLSQQDAAEPDKAAGGVREAIAQQIEAEAARQDTRAEQAPGTAWAADLRQRAYTYRHVADNVRAGNTQFVEAQDPPKLAAGGLITNPERYLLGEMPFQREFLPGPYEAPQRHAEDVSTLTVVPTVQNPMSFQPGEDTP